MHEERLLGQAEAAANRWQKAWDPASSMFLAYVQPLVAQYGLYAVFVIVMLESAGVPLPGETALVLASIYAGATGDLHIAQVIAAAAAGAIIGDNMGFWVGRHFGMPLLKRYGRLFTSTRNGSPLARRCSAATAQKSCSSAGSLRSCGFSPLSSPG